MNLKYLGDALDHWKGSIFEHLQDSGVVQDFAIDPMASDGPEWLPEDIALLATLLRVKRDQLISHKYSLSNRAAYFGEISHKGDLFLDPDTGIATGRITGEHLAPQEINDLLAVEGRLVVVYQHVRAARVCDRVDAVCAAVREVCPSVHWCSYEAGTVAMLFLAVQRARIQRVSAQFELLLGRHATGRIRTSRREA